MHDKLFEAALGIQAPWSVISVKFDEASKVLTVDIDFKRGSRFGVEGHEGLHPVHDTVVKEYQHLNFFQHECKLRVRTPRVKLPDGSVRLHEPEFSGRLSGFTLLFEALILMLTQTRQTNGFLEALNGLFQAAKRRARRFTRLSTIKTVIFLIAG